ncbi:MAG: GDSL family lipase [Deltaproteobacteria bacterium HGW-Deltaproteobacteria-22]|nr:MAG: GDSL family lipase [Deltaproteobacteria bacterium HGW-Deltaproteobacteria-22]
MFGRRLFILWMFFQFPFSGGCRSDHFRPGCAQPQAPRPAPQALALSLSVPAAPPAAAWNERTTPLVPVLHTTDPQPRPKVRWWMRRFDQLSRKVASMSSVEILFVGDSITEEWAESGEVIWRRHFSHRAINLGVGGDRTQNILWRLKNTPMECSGLSWAVVMAGTNNLGDSDSDADIFEGVAAIVYHLLDQCPSTRVILMGILPREPASFMGSIRRINDMLARLDNGTSVRYLDLGPQFLSPDGSIPGALMPDSLHLSARGYQIWADALRPFLDAP